MDLDTLISNPQRAQSKLCLSLEPKLTAGQLKLISPRQRIHPQAEIGHSLAEKGEATGEAIEEEAISGEAEGEISGEAEGEVATSILVNRIRLLRLEPLFLDRSKELKRNCDHFEFFFFFFSFI